MSVKPISEMDANGDVREQYKGIKQALKVQYLPVFFSYIGPFPEYLKYLSEQLSPILNDAKFESLIDETKEKLYPLIKSSLNKSEEIKEWIKRYKNSPSFYNFQKDLEKIFIVNLKLVFIFVALREALKGWAIAAKKLTASNSTLNEEKEELTKKDNLIFDDSLLLAINQNNLQENDQRLHTSNKIEKDMLPRYIFLCQQDYNQLMKTERYLILRVGIEKLILSSLTLLPNKIVSPINVFYKITEKYEEFPELLYLMCEHFPTFAVQKMLFSGFMKE